MLGAAVDAEIRRYQGVVYGIARRMAEKFYWMQTEDFVSIGLEALNRAVRRFDPSRRVKLKTYLSYRVRGAMLDHLRSLDWVPRLTRARAKKSGAVLPSIMSLFTSPVDLVPAHGDIRDKRVDSVRNALSAVRVRELLHAKLNPVWARIMYEYVVEERTEHDIGRRTGYSESRVCQILQRARERLQRCVTVEELARN